jgi:hypothetical protein
MISYGTLYCTVDGSKRDGYFEDQPRENEKFILHGNAEEGTTLLPRIFGVSKVPLTLRETYTHDLVSGEIDTMPGDWVFYTHFSRYILREYHKKLPYCA